MTPDDLAFLVAHEPLLQRLSAEDLSDANTLTLLTQLRKDYTASQASAALTMARLRLKAVEKFGADAARMFFTDAALQQASDPSIRRYRAQSIATAGDVLDLCCGIGADALAFAAAGMQSVVGLDIDPLRVAMAQQNARVLGLHNIRFDVVDVTTDNAYRRFNAWDTVFFDPARRDAAGKRIFSVTDYIPPLATINQYTARQKWVKLSPGVDLSQLDDYPAYVEFISVNGELKEALLRFHDGDSRDSLATLITNDHIYHWRRETVPDVPIAAPRRWLVEPDPALIRAGLVQDAAAAFDGALLDETIAYFTTDHQPDSPWLRAWQILDWMPFNLKKVRAYLRSHHVGRLTVKKRGSPLTPEEFISRMKLKGTESRTVVLTRHNNQPFVLICADYTV